MTTSAHVSLDSETKIRNLMIALHEVGGQLVGEDRFLASAELAQAYLHLEEAISRHHIKGSRKASPND